jgi:hypothetical protein
LRQNSGSDERFDNTRASRQFCAVIAMVHGPLVPPSESRYLRELRTDDDSLNEWIEKVPIFSRKSSISAAGKPSCAWRLCRRSAKFPIIELGGKIRIERLTLEI